VNVGVIEQFEADLNTYIKSGKAKKQGIPSVSYFADIQHLSPNYFGNLVKRESGKSAQEYIQSKLIKVAKEKIFDPEKSISHFLFIRSGFDIHSLMQNSNDFNFFFFTVGFYRK